MKRYWFKRKRYGYGWYPATWEGWLVLAAYVVFLVFDFIQIDAHSHSNSDTIRPFVIHMVLLMIVLLGVCYLTGEKPRWQWGDRTEDAKDAKDKKQP